MEQQTQGQEQNKPAVKKKAVGNKNTEIIVGAAANKLAAAVISINSAVEVVGKLSSEVDTKTLQVVELEDKIGGLKQDFENQKAQNKLNIELQYKADEAGFTDQYLAKKNLTAIPTSEYQALKDELSTTKAEVENRVRSEVGKAEAILKNKHENEVKIKDLELKNQQAENTAKITHLEEQNKFLAEQVQMWKQQLEDQRKAETERSKNSAVGTINVGQPGR